MDRPSWHGRFWPDPLSAFYASVEATLFGQRLASSMDPVENRARGHARPSPVTIRGPGDCKLTKVAVAEGICSIVAVAWNLLREIVAGLVYF